VLAASDDCDVWGVDIQGAGGLTCRVRPLPVSTRVAAAMAGRRRLIRQCQAAPDVLDSVAAPMRLALFLRRGRVDQDGR
jgi:hypothetical protein